MRRDGHLWSSCRAQLGSSTYLNGYLGGRIAWRSGIGSLTNGMLYVHLAQYRRGRCAKDFCAESAGERQTQSWIAAWGQRVMCLTRAQLCCERSYTCQKWPPGAPAQLPSCIGTRATRRAHLIEMRPQRESRRSAARATPLLCLRSCEGRSLRVVRHVGRSFPNMLMTRH